MKIINIARGEQVPLFNSLFLESGAVCNRTCIFCPNHGNKRPEEWMSMALIEKAATELASLKYNGRIATYIYNEPVRDERLPDILRLLRAAVPRAHLMISTNGDYFKSTEDMTLLFEAGLTQLLINVYSAADGNHNPEREAKGIHIAEARYEQLDAWAKKVPHVTMDGDVYGHVKLESRQLLIERKWGIGDKDKKHKRIARFQLSNRSGNLPWFVPAPVDPLKKMCVRPWRALNVNWRGDAILCCNDYHGKIKLGNLKRQTLVEMWNSPVMNKYRLWLQNKRRDIKLCDTCDYDGGYFQHMISPVTYGSKAKDREMLK